MMIEKLPIDRVVGYDLARALALFGMVLVNFRIVMCYGQADAGPSWLISAATLVEGRAAATFVVLAGIGISLMTRQARATNDGQRMRLHRRQLIKRALFLFMVGTLYTPIWPADILHFYGVYIAMAAMLLLVRSVWLMACALALCVVFSVLVLVLDYEAGWDWESLTYQGMWTLRGWFRHMFFNGFHPVLPWLSFLLLGMVIGRTDLRQRAARMAVMKWGATVVVVTETASWLLVRSLSNSSGQLDADTIAALLGTSPMPPMPFYMLAAGGLACVVIATCVSIGEAFGSAAPIRPFVSTGQLALTLYVAHVIIGMGGLEELGLLQNQSQSFAMAAAAIFCLVAVVFAHVWRLRFNLGPLEGIMRRLTAVKSAPSAAES